MARRMKKSKAVRLARERIAKLLQNEDEVVDKFDRNQISHKTYVQRMGILRYEQSLADEKLAEVLAKTEGWLRE